MSAIMPPEAVNYPDVLGLITNNHRLNLDVIQCAMTTRPDKVAAGQHFEVLFLVQNASDIDVDVTIDLQLPKEDAAHKSGMFYSKSSRLLVGLQPAEVGYVTLPVSCSPKTLPYSGYQISANIKVEHMDKQHRPQRVRNKDGGGAIVKAAFSDERRQQLLELHKLTWETEHQGKPNHIVTTFEITPPSIAMLREFTPGWISLWSMKDHIDDRMIKERVQPQLSMIMPHLTKEEMVEPLLEATNTWFGKACYPLHEAEALFITKLLTVVLCEVGVEQPSRINPNPIPPQWYTHLTQVLFSEPRLASFPLNLVKDNIYPHLVYDAVIHGFRMVTTVLNEDFGTPEEMQSYADVIRNAFQKGIALNYGQVYLPLVLAGVIANNRISLPNENIRESIFSISKAQEKRASEMNEDNSFIAEMTKKLVDRSLDYIAAL